jgi:hypothetical protein
MPSRLAAPNTRLASGFLLLLMTAGCFVLWIGVPVGSLWVASKATEDSVEHYLIALPLTLVGMVLFARALFWINRLYIRVMAARHRGEVADEWDDELDGPRWARGPLEPLLIGSLAIAFVAFCVWFFLLAENPSPQVI